VLLSFDFLEIHRAGGGGRRRLAVLDRLDRNHPGQVIDQHCQRLNRDDLDLRDQGGFAGVDRRDQQLAKTLPVSQGRHREHPAYVPHRAVERQLADDQCRFEPLGFELPGGRQRSQGDRQVVGRPFLAQRRRRQVDRQALARKDQAGVLDRRLNAFATLLNGCVRQTNDGEGGKPARSVHFHFNDCPLQPHNGAGVDLGEHGPSLEDSAPNVNRAGKAELGWSLAATRVMVGGLLDLARDRQVCVRVDI